MVVLSAHLWIPLGVLFLKVWAKKDPLLCDTNMCMEESERLKEHIDEKVNPCEDFHMFACGKFLRNVRIPANETHISTRTKLDDIVKRQIKSILADAPALPTDPKYVSAARKLYKTCLRKDLGNRSVEILLDMIKQAGGWPLMEGEKWDKDKFDWMDAVFKLHDFGFRTTNIFGFSIVKNFEKPDEYIIKIDEANLGMDADFLIEGPERNEIQSYVFYLLELATHLGADELSFRQSMSEILYFEIELARILTEGKEKNVLPPPMLLADLKQRHSEIDWITYSKHMLGNIATLKPDEKVIVNKITFVRKLEEILKRTHKKTLANFLMYRAAREAANFLTDDIRKLDFEFTKMYHGRLTPEPRWKECVTYTEKNMDLAVGSLYIKKFITPEAKSMVQALTERLHLELKKTLEKLDWLEGESRKKALEKSRKLKKFIAYPKEVLDVKNLREFYKKVDLNKETLLEQHLELNKFKWNFQVSRLRMPVIKNDWRDRGGIARLRAGFNYFQNTLSVSAGLMQGALFSEYKPRYLNFGAMGYKIGHELTHGFDYKGQHYDERGNFKEWWEKDTIFKFMEKTKCVFNEAVNFTVLDTNMTLDAKNTLRENVADYGGIALAYRAFNTWMTESHLDRIKLIGFEHYTEEQMFWISAGTSLCAKYSKERLQVEVQNGEQSTPDYRINVPFRNHKAFAEDFKCSEGEYMNPQERCSVW